MRAVRRMARTDVVTVDVRRSYYERYNRWLQRAMVGTAWTMSNNYYKSASGRIVTQWPYGSVPYGMLTKVLGPLSQIVTRESSGFPAAPPEGPPPAAGRVTTGTTGTTAAR